MFYKTWLTGCQLIKLVCLVSAEEGLVVVVGVVDVFVVVAVFEMLLLKSILLISWPDLKGDSKNWSIASS
jgi:hypothetical protein